MSYSFNPHQGLVLVDAELEGPTGTSFLRLALDTGATDTLVSLGLLIGVGYDPALASSWVQVTTGSGIVQVPRLTITRLKSLGQERITFPVLGHTLPASAGVNGVLGLDFVRGMILTIDFRTGKVTLL